MHFSQRPLLAAALGSYAILSRRYCTVASSLLISGLGIDQRPMKKSPSDANVNEGDLPGVRGAGNWQVRDCELRGSRHWSPCLTDPPYCVALPLPARHSRSPSRRLGEHARSR